MRNRLNLIVIIIVLVSLIFLVTAAPSWIISGTNSSFLEDLSPTFTYNFSANITGASSEANYVFEEGETYPILSSYHGLQDLSFYTWISLNASTGILNITSDNDNETGRYNISVDVVDGGESAGARWFYFMINATNDFPNFTNIETEYNSTQNIAFLNYVNATDEEEHYPLSFDINFFEESNCSLADWSTRTNCSLFEITDLTNTSAIMNFTPTRNDVGNYWANITVTDYGENYNCPHSYCDNSTYEQNKTTYSSLITFRVLGNLEINISDCNNSVFQENQSNTCVINVTTKGETNQINISSIASIRNYPGTVSNTSWFYLENITNAISFTVIAYINVTPQKTEIGNWTINFTVIDTTAGQNLTEEIFIYVNRTNNDVPNLVEIPNQGEISVDKNTIINLTVYDDDLLIPDKLEGYNETTTFDVKILNQSDLSQELSITGFDVDILSMPVSGTNRTEAKIDFTPNSSNIGNYTINITVNDSDNALDSKMFNFSIVSNNYPTWNESSYSFNLTVNSTYGTTESFYLNLTNGYASDPDAEDNLTFSNNSGAFPGFVLNSDGIVNFTPWKADVGNWTFTINATDGLGLTNSTIFTFNITNINSAPLIETPISATNASGNSNLGIIAEEDNYTIMNLFTRDNDFLITHKNYYNESLNVNLSIEGPNENLFNFTIDPAFAPNPAAGNRSRYTVTFIPNKSDVGSYNITINVSDASNASDILVFNLTIIVKQHSPVLANLTNHTSAVNRTLYYDINATDEEDGDDTSGNLKFNMTFLQGTDFVRENESIFNTTSGILNITFNDTQPGIYHINVSVNDSTNRSDYEDMWIYVYGNLNITFPDLYQNFSLQENVTTNLTFRGNHSIQDNLTYEFYINNNLKYNITYYGNNTNLTWSYAPNFTDETYGEYLNLTLLIYPTSSDLANNTLVNHSIDWNINITHTNSPIIFSDNIGDRQKNYDQDISIDLTIYFSDIDFSDPYYNQTVNFTITSNATNSNIQALVYPNWTLVLSAVYQDVTLELVTINASDKNMSNTSQSLTYASSNSFIVEFTEPTTTTVPSTGGGSSTIIKIVSLEIIMPDPVSAYSGERIVLPITLRNNGEKELKKINLSSTIVKDNQLREDIKISFDTSYFDSLKVGEEQNITMTIDINTEEIGTYEITLKADVKDPVFTDWGKLYLTVKEGEKISERLLFTEEFIQENPECIEIEEIVDEAREYFKNGDFVNTVIKINEAIDGCKNAISQEARTKRREPEENMLYRYLLIATIAAFVLGIMYHSYKRIRLKRGIKESVLEKPTSASPKKPVTSLLIIFFIGAILGILISLNKNITGFVVSNSSNQKLGLGFIFIIGVLGILIFIKKENIKKTIEKISKKHTKDRIKGLINKKTYSSAGDYLGRVEEAILKKNKIHSLKIKLDKSKMKKTKGVIINYKYVEDVGEIIIIKDFKLKHIK